MVKYSVYQLVNHNKLFMDYEFTTKEWGEPDLSEYKNIYDGKVDVKEIKGNEIYHVLDDIFRLHNLKHVEGYKGHSLSVSDIIYIDTYGYYFVDDIGFVKLKNDVG